MQLNADDHAKIKRGVDWEAAITDQVTGRRYLVRGADCSLPDCVCDAVVIREID
jgi:hypothetical protein